MLGRLSRRETPRGRKPPGAFEQLRRDAQIAWPNLDPGAVLTLFVSDRRERRSTALRVFVPTVRGTAEPVLALLRDRYPACYELAITLPDDGFGAEQWLIDRWARLAEGDRESVVFALGRQAGCLMRFSGRPMSGFAFLGRREPEDGPANPQSRALLASAYPDSWTLALDDGPQGDADRWRFRLATVLSERWGIGLVEKPIVAFEALMAELDIPGPLPPPKLMFAARPPAAPQAPVRSIDWLDVELDRNARQRLESGSVVDEERGADPPPAADVVWRRARAAAIERRLRTRKSIAQVEGRGATGRVEIATPATLLVEDPFEAAARLDPKVLSGKGRQLFLGEDSHDSHARLTERRPLPREDLDRWDSGIRERVVSINAAGATYALLIGPAPQVVLQDRLPDGVAVDEQRPVIAVLDRLAEMESSPALYPLAALLDVPDGLSAFPTTDSHWNDLGAYLAYEALVDRIGPAWPGRRVGRRDLSFHETVSIGDLGSKLRPERAGIVLRARLDRPAARLVDDNHVRNHGRMAVFECEVAPPSTCLLFGDSWSYSTILFLAESFRRLVFFHRVNVVDAEPIRAERPDLVLTLLTERFVTALPDDAAAVSFEAVVAKKLRKGHILPEAPPGTRPGSLHSLELDRGLPDRPGYRLPDRRERLST